jgi:hypothetical protein
LGHAIAIPPCLPPDGVHLKDGKRIIFIESRKKKKSLPTIREDQSKLIVALSHEAFDEFRSFGDGPFL